MDQQHNKQDDNNLTIMESPKHWRHEHGPLMNLEDGVAYPGRVNISFMGMMASGARWSN
jgi:hypothetical protein